MYNNNNNNNMNNIYCQKCGAPSAAASKPSFCHRCGANMLGGGAKSQTAAQELPSSMPKKRLRPPQYDVDVDNGSDFEDDVEADIDYDMAMRASKLDFDFERIDNNNPVKIENVIGSSQNNNLIQNDRGDSSVQSYSMDDFAREAGSLRSK